MLSSVSGTGDGTSGFRPWKFPIRVVSVQYRFRSMRLGARVLVGLVCALMAAPASAIIDGRVASPGAYPWMVALVSNNVRPQNAPSGQFCGGVLIAPKRVLTAAHCLEGLGSPRSFRVIVGRSRLSANDGEQIAVRAYGHEPRFGSGSDSDTIPYDVGIIELSRAAREPTIPLLSAAEGAATAPGTAVRMVGWGAIRQVSPDPFTDAVEIPSDTLREADLKILSGDQCERVDGRFFIASLMTCVVDPVRGSGVACHGDSGGPLIVQTASGWRLLGVTSFGTDGCDAKGVPAVFSSATGMAHFILSRRPILAPAPVRRPRVQGRRDVGKTLRCARGKWRGSAGRTYFRWYWATEDLPSPDVEPPTRQLRADITQLAGWQLEPIPRSTGATHRLTDDDVDQRVTCISWTRNVGGQGLAVASPTARIK